MPKRKILITKSYEKGLKDWRKYKIKTEQDLRHYISKIRAITKEIIRISELQYYPYKKVSYRNSRKTQYFIYQQHVIFFRLSENTMKFLYFVSTKRVKTKYI